MAEKETTLNELAEMLAHVVEHMVTKDDIKDMATKSDLKLLATKDDLTAFATQVSSSIERELKSLRHDLYELLDRADNMIGYRMEINHALARIAAIEQHIGIDRKIDA